jgi:hypothetical protein
MCLATGCTQIVGPARTYSSYEEKAAETADAALSAVRTATLVADGAVDDDLLGPYTSVMLSEAEAAVAGAESTFSSLQPPPGTAADQVRHSMEGLLQRAGDELIDMRIEARRGQLDGLGAHGPALVRIADDLEAFSGRHQ